MEKQFGVRALIWKRNKRDEMKLLTVEKWFATETALEKWLTTMEEAGNLRKMLAKTFR